MLASVFLDPKQLAARVAELESTLAAVTAERDKLRRAYEQLKEHLELLRRRIFVAKAERIDVTQLQLADPVGAREGSVIGGVGVAEAGAAAVEAEEEVAKEALAASERMPLFAVRLAKPRKHENTTGKGSSCAPQNVNLADSCITRGGRVGFEMPIAVPKFGLIWLPAASNRAVRSMSWNSIWLNRL